MRRLIWVEKLTPALALVLFLRRALEDIEVRYDEQALAPGAERLLRLLPGETTALVPRADGDLLAALAPTWRELSWACASATPAWAL